MLDLFVELFGCACDQNRIGDPITLNHRSQSHGILKLSFIFKAKIDNLKTAAMILAIELFEKGRLP
jgi:hypothetical protein